MSDVSQNGWTLIWDSSGLDRSPIPGTTRTIELRAGAVRVVLDYLCAEFHDRVEALDEGQRDDWGWAEPVPIPGSSTFSNHGSGTAVDLNATRHPWGERETFGAAQVAAIEDILLELKGTVRWGGHYTGKTDEMHFEINASESRVSEVATALGGSRGDLPDPRPRLLSLGSTGSQVAAVQARLNRDYPRHSRLEVDGDYGPSTEAVVREFQLRSGLSVDGVVGPETRLRLGL